MRIDVSQTAVQALAERYGAPSGYSLQLVYDTEGCGCAVSGVPDMWVMPHDTNGPLMLSPESDLVRFVLEKRHEIFFEDRLRLDYRPDKRAFVLQSDGQIYNPDLRLIDKR